MDNRAAETQAISALKAGDIQGLAFLVHRYQIHALRTAYLIVGDRAAAEDIVQDVFVRLYQRIDQFDSARPFEPWLLRSVVHEALKASERQKRAQSLDTGTHEDPTWTLADQSPSPEALVEASDRQKSVRRALDQLPPSQRAAIVLRYYLDMDEQTISETVHAPLGTIKWRIYTAIRRLRALLRLQSLE